MLQCKSKLQEFSFHLFILFGRCKVKIKLTCIRFLLTVEMDGCWILETIQPQVDPPQYSWRDPAQTCGADQTVSAARTKKDPIKNYDTDV